MFLGLALTFPLRLVVWGGEMLRPFTYCWRRAPLGSGLGGDGPTQCGTSLILEGGSSYRAYSISAGGFPIAIVLHCRVYRKDLLLTKHKAGAYCFTIWTLQGTIVLLSVSCIQ